MIDLKAIYQELDSIGLLDKPIRSFTADEIRDLCTAVQWQPVEAEGKKNCRMCWYSGWKKEKPYCQHPDHPAPIHAWTYRLACNHYSPQNERSPKAIKSRKPRLEG